MGIVIKTWGAFQFNSALQHLWRDGGVCNAGPRGGGGGVLEVDSTYSKALRKSISSQCKGQLSLCSQVLLPLGVPSMPAPACITLFPSQ